MGALVFFGISSNENLDYAALHPGYGCLKSKVAWMQRSGIREA
jgi:hypothetical protein